MGTVATANKQKIFYVCSKALAHLGIVVDYKNRIILSKWGQGARMKHKDTHRPYWLAPVVKPFKYYK